MKATDFVYDGIHLSAFGFIVVDFDSESSWSPHTTDSQKDYKNLTQLRGKFMPFSAVAYSDAIKVEFSIIKNPDTAANPVISLAERRQIKRWLNRDHAHQFSLVDAEYDGIFWEGAFNIEEVFFSGECYGLNLTMYTNRPFALGEAHTETGSLTTNEGSNLTINVMSDDDGYITPNEVAITCGEAGTLKLVNQYDNRTMVIDNCVANEVITMDSSLQITSTVTNHDLANDFNYVFLRLNSSFSDGNINTLVLGSGSIPCEVSITYNPIIKAVIV